MRRFKNREVAKAFRKRAHSAYNPTKARRKISILAATGDTEIFIVFSLIKINVV